MFYTFPLRNFFLGLLLVGMSAPLSATELVTFDFYDQKLELYVPDNFVYPYQLRIEEMALRSLYQEFERRPYQSLLTDLQEKASLLQLNDWLFSQLILQPDFEQITQRVRKAFFHTIMHQDLSHTIL